MRAAMRAAIPWQSQLIHRTHRFTLGRARTHRRTLDCRPGTGLHLATSPPLLLQR